MSLFAPHPEWHMPTSFRPFSWIEPEALGACIYPQSDVELAELAGLGVGLLVNLHERAHAPATLERHGLRQLHIPVPDMTPPSPEQLITGVGQLQAEREAGTRVVVHCAVGLGRTGTLIACYFVSQGMSADEAIAHVRAARPGSVETRAQEQAVADYTARISQTRS